MALRVTTILRITATMMTLALLPAAARRLEKALRGGLYTARAQGCHVENVTNGHATPIDTAVSLKLSAIEVVGRETDQGGDLLAINLAEFRQRGEERIGEVGPTPAWR